MTWIVSEPSNEGCAHYYLATETQARRLREHLNEMRQDPNYWEIWEVVPMTDDQVDEVIVEDLVRLIEWREGITDKYVQAVTEWAERKKIGEQK
jgi:hypothetical protein